MGREFDTVLGRVRWESDERSLTVTVGRRRPRRIAWDSITAAGLVQMQVPEAERDVPDQVLEEMGKGLPGLGRIVQINDTLAGEYRQLVLARGAAFTRAVRIPIPLGDAEASALVTEVSSRLGPRWRGELAVGRGYERELGMRMPWWTVPVTILFLVGIGFLVLFAFAGFSALSQGKFDLPLAVWIGMAVWLALVGLILLLYRRLR